jgi:hypothetical protein
VRSYDIRTNKNGTIQLVDRFSNSPLWEISTGPPPTHEVTAGDSSLRYLIYPPNGDSNELVEFNNGTAVVCFARARLVFKIFLILFYSSTLCSSCRYFPGNWRILLLELRTYRILLLLLDQKFQPFLSLTLIAARLFTRTACQQS